MRESPFSRVEPLSEALAEIFLDHLELPFAFFGHSVGALISFELARKLRERQLPTPLHLFVSARRAPQIPKPKSPVHQLPDPAFVESVRRYSGTPQQVLQDPELRSLFLPILRADLAVDETYVYLPQAPLDCSISALGGLCDPEVNMEELEAWREQTTKKFTLFMFPGDHFFLKQYRDALLTVISQDLSPIINL